MDVGSNKQLEWTGCFSSAKIQIASYVCYNIFIKGKELLFIEDYHYQRKTPVDDVAWGM